MPALPLIGPSYTNRALPLSAQVTKGYFPQVDTEARTIVSLNPFPGLNVFTSMSGKGRGMHVMNGTLFAIAGGTLYEIGSDAVPVGRGAIAGGGICDFANDDTEMAITTGTTPYVYDGQLQVIADPDLSDPTTVCYLNSQFIFDQNAGVKGDFVTSDVGTALSIDGLNFANAESHPDDILRAIAHDQLVYFFGSETIEPWFNSGTGAPPFDRVQGSVRPFGLAGKDAVTVSDDFIYFIDNKRIPRRMVGLDVQPIGNPALGNEWSDYERVDDAVCISYTLDQQNFFQVTFPTADRTWLYHEPSGSWSQLSYGVDNGRHRGVTYARAYGKNLVQDHSNGKIYELSMDDYTDDGEPIQRVRATAIIHSGLYGERGRRVFYDRVEFVVQTGEGINTGQGSDPVIDIRHSDNSGRTWSAWGTYGLGRGGEYMKRVELFNQGSAFERIYELRQTDPVPATLISAHADISFGI